MNQINNLIALKSVFELKMGHKSLGHFIKNISDKAFAKKMQPFAKKACNIAHFMV